MEDEKALSDPWLLFTNWSSCIDGSEAGLIITNPEGMEFTYSLRFRFDATNNEMTPIHEYLIEEILSEKRKKQGLYAAKQRGACSMHAGPRSVVAKALRSGHYWPTMHVYARKLIRECNDCQIEEISHVLWAHRTMIKSSNGETPFSLTYGTKAVILVDIGMPTWRTTEFDMIKNNEALEINLDLLKEKREQAAIQEAKSKAMMEKYYNVRVRNTSFKPGDLVYQSNEASHAKDGGKLGPKWEGPYEVTEALGKGAYKLKDRNGNTLLRTWNICNLKKCYVHE
nr:reverse transcriptase domain-containing protein [Tanacetum cinerariifolium]